MTRRQSLLLVVVLAFALVSLAAAQQQDQASATPNPLVQVLQNKGVLTAQEAAAINQAPTPAEQQSRLTQLLYSKGIITQDEYKDTAAAEASRAYQPQGLWLPTAAHASAGEPDAAVAAAPQAPPAPAVIPAVAPVRVLTSDPPKAGGMVPDIKLGSGAKLKLYGFIKSTAAYDTSNPMNIGFELPGLGGTANGTIPSDVPTGLNSNSASIPGVNSTDTGPNGSPTTFIKASATRMGANFEWPDIAGSNNTLTGRFEFDDEGNFSRATNRNASSIRTRMFALRLAWARLDHAFSDSTTGFVLFGMDWSPFGSSVQMNILETEGGAAFFGDLYERQAQIRAGLWHKFRRWRDFTIGVEPAISMMGTADLPTDVGVQLGVSERQGTDVARPEISGRVVFQWQLDTARGVPPAQIIFSGFQGKRRELVTRAALQTLYCFPADSGTAAATACASGRTANQITAVNDILAAFPKGASVASPRFGGAAGFQLPTRYATLVGQYFAGSDLRWYFASQNFTAFNDNRAAQLFNLPPSLGGAVCGINGGASTTVLCPQVFDMDASGPNPTFGFTSTGAAAIMPQHPPRTQGGFTQISFPLSRIFNANPAGHHAGWILSFAAGTDQVKGRDILAANATAQALSANLLPNGAPRNSLGNRNRSDSLIGTLVWRFNQYVSFNYESSLYQTRARCDGNQATITSFGFVCGTFSTPASGANTGIVNFVTSNTPFEGLPARHWHDWRNEFGPVFTF